MLEDKELAGKEKEDIQKEDIQKFIQDKNINFLIGAGASYGAYPTLSTNIVNNEGEKLSFEEVVTKLEGEGDDKKYHKYLFFFKYFYYDFIYKAFNIEFDDNKPDKYNKVKDNYVKLLEYTLHILNRRKVNDNKKCNIFTTNYDGLIEAAGDELIKKGEDFILNDGTRGFKEKKLEIRNFDTEYSNIGIFNKSLFTIPSINLIKLHGSIFSNKSSSDDSIIVNYNESLNVFGDDGEDFINDLLGDCDCLMSNLCTDSNNVVCKICTNSTLPKSHIWDNSKLFIGDLCDNYFSFTDDFLCVDYSTPLTFYSSFLNLELDNNIKEKLEKFWDSYEKIPIVNPTKYKFYETVFDEHYYQMLRFLGYELEKENSLLIVFGFSFADEHIRNLIKRSLKNPTLKTYLFCFNGNELKNIKELFKGFNNIKYFSLDKKNLDFDNFLKLLNGADIDETTGGV